MPDLPFDNCKGKGVAASNGSLLTEEEKAFFNGIAEEVKKEKTGNNSESLSDRIAMRVDLAIKNDKFKALQQKRSAAINYLKGQELIKTVSAWPDKIQGANALMVGSDRVGKDIPLGGRNSIASDYKQRFDGALGELKARLDRENLTKLAKTKGAELGIFQELWRKGRTEEELKDSPNKFPEGGRPEYKKIADIIHQSYQPLLDQANRLGAFINNLPGYIMRQSHDMLSIRKAGGESAVTPEAKAKNAAAYSDFIAPLLDWKEMSKNEGKEIEPKAFLHSVWEGLASGVHLKANPENMDTVSSFGGQDLASKVSAYRKLLFKDAASFQKYNDKFGQKNLMEGVSSSLGRLSENIALMNRFGTNPQNMVDKLFNSLRGQTRMDFNDGRKWYALERNWNYVSGQSRIPLNQGWAKAGATVRAYNVLTSLGQAVTAHLTNLTATGPSELHYQGISPLVGFFSQIKGMIENTVNPDKRYVANRIGVGLEGFIHNFYSPFEGAQDVPGLMSKISQSFYALNGERPFSNALSGAVSNMMSNHFAEMAGLSFEKLPLETQRLFGLYDIKPMEWDSIRKGVEDVGGSKQLFPDSVRGIPKEEIAKMVEAKGQKVSDRTVALYRDDLESRFRNQYIDRVDYANLKPGAKEMSILHFGTRPGTPEGEAARFIAQFKAYPVAYFTKTLSRDLYGRTGNAERIGAMATVAAATTIGGFGSLTLNALASGKTPPDPTKWATFQASMVKGGGLGILTDYIFGEGTIGRSPMDTALGPTFGKVNSILSMYQKAKDISAEEAFGEKTKGYASLKDDFSRNIRSLIPFNNLIYLKGLFEYQVLYRMNEMLNPGYLDRMKERMKSGSGQQFIIPPN